MENILELQNLTCHRGAFSLGPLNWQLPAGLFCCIVGPNGAGKTSLLQALMGLIHVRNGSWAIAGAKINPRQGAWKELIGYAFDGQMHHEKLNVGENLKLHADLRQSWDQALAAELMTSFKLDSKQIVASLSRGQRQALSLILALAPRPALLLLDEVTNGMDSLVRKAWNDIIFRMMAESDMSVIMATHVMSDVANLADRLVFIQGGRILADVDKDSLHDKWRQISCRFPGTMAALPHTKRWEQRGESLRFITTQAAQDLQILKEKGASHMEAHPLTLDEICFYTLENNEHV